MKKLLAISASVAIGLAPAIGAACDYHADHASSASATPPVFASTSQVPAATKVPATVVAKAPVKKSAKAVKAKAPIPDQKVAALTR